jgi:hypothetical protein
VGASTSWSPKDLSRLDLHLCTQNRADRVVLFDPCRWDRYQQSTVRNIPVFRRSHTAAEWMAFGPVCLGGANSPILRVDCQKGRNDWTRSQILTAVARNVTAFLGTRQRVPPERWCIAVHLTWQYIPKDSDLP